MPVCMDLPDHVEIKQPDILNVDLPKDDVNHDANDNAYQDDSEEAYDFEESKQPSVQNQRKPSDASLPARDHREHSPAADEDYISDEIQEEYEDDQFD